MSNINIVGPINQLGYGITVLNIVKSLSKISNVSLCVIGQPQVTNQQDADILRSCISNFRFLDFDAPCIKIWHQNDMTQFAGRGKRIGFPIFELDTFNILEKHHLSSLDKIFVCSSWAKDVVLNNINIDEKNVHVITLGVDSSIFNPAPINNNITTRFFNCGKWEIRKGHDILVKAFNMAFDNNDDVELVLMCENPFYTKEENEQWNKLYLDSKMGSKIRIIPRQNTQQEVYNIMLSAHCGIFPSRAEGWNLELLEMMSCGKHVITTNYSAHTEFCNSLNARLVDINESEPAYDNKWFHGDGNWAKINDSALNQIVDHMKSIHRERLNNTLTTNIHGINTAKKFNWDKSAMEITKNVF